MEICLRQMIKRSRPVFKKKKPLANLVGYLHCRFIEKRSNFPLYFLKGKGAFSFSELTAGERGTHTERNITQYI